MTAEEFKISVLPSKNKLYRFAYRILDNIEEAEDIVQEVFVRLWTKKDELKNCKSIDAFSMVITKNLCLDKLKLKRNNKTELTEWNTPANFTTPYKITEMSDTINKVHKFIQQLPEQQRMIIQMRDVEGFEYEEIANILQINVNTLRVNLSRARKTIRDKLIKKLNYEFKGN